MGSPTGLKGSIGPEIKKINLNCFLLFFVFVFFFCVKVFTCEVPVDVKKKEKERCCVLQWQEAVLHELMDCCCQT